VAERLTSEQGRRGRWWHPGSGPGGFTTLALAIAAGALFFGLGGLSAWHNDLGHLALDHGLLQADSREGDAFLNRAGQQFQEALRWNPQNGWAYYNLGAIYLAWGQARAAQEAFERAARAIPENQLTNYQLGILYDEQDQEEQAIAAWQKAGAAPWLVAEGRECQSQGDSACAERFYELAIAVQPETREAHYRLGVLYAGLGRKAEAIEAYNRALSLESERNPERFLIEARMRALEGQWEAAIAAYQQAIALNPYDSEPYEEIGAILLSQLHDVEGAIGWYQAASRVEPQRAAVPLTLAGIYAEAQSCPDAEIYYRQALELSQESPTTAAEAQAGLSRCALASGDAEAAAQAAEEAVAAQPEAAGYRVLLGDAYVESGHFELAIASYRAALELEPGNRRARQQLEALGWHEP
jgi:tetratricopeptide (TPR) repeat protein